MSSDSKILHYTRFVPMDYMRGPDSDAVASYAYIDVRNELAKSLMENMKTSKEYIVKFDRLTGEDHQLRGMYRIDGYLSMKPVWHGHWATLPNGNIQCSECGHKPLWSGDWKPHYCQNCGAYMDEESEGE